MAKKTSHRKDHEPVQDIPVEEENEQLSESYISIGLGLLVVVVVGVLLYNYITQRNQNTTSAPESTEQITQEATSAARPGSTYTVVAGDTLWSISEKSYGTGFNWTAIAEANDLDPNNAGLTEGQQLRIPEVTPAASAIAETTSETAPTATVAPSASPVVIVSASPVASPIAQVSPQASPITQVSPAPVTTGTSITGTNYTIVPGDTLWDIACRAYGDCYQWTKIAQANGLEHPNLIHAGNTLTLPR